MTNYAVAGALESGRLLDALRSADQPPPELLARAATLSKDPEWKSACLRAAAINDQHVAIASLIEQGFDPMADEGSCLILATDRGNHETVSSILRCGVSPMIHEGEAFVVAASVGSLECFNILLTYAGHIAQPLAGIALFAALGGGWPRMVRRLLDLIPKIEPSWWDQIGRSALLPRGAVSIEMIQMLEGHGCGAEQYSTILLPEAAWNQDLETVNWLLEKDVDLSYGEFSTLRSAVNGDSMACFEAVVAKLMAKGQLDASVLSTLRKFGMESYASMAEFAAMGAGYQIPEAT